MKGSRYKIDLHTHSIISQDGGITASQYEKILASGELDCLAITDHNETSFARIMQKKLGDRIIIGEEIATKQGEIIGLYLTETIPGGISIDEAIASIKHQGGIVYVPHPFEKFRKGLQAHVMTRIAADIDIVEVFNGRGRFRGKPDMAVQFAQKNSIPQAASSDAHGVKGLGYASCELTEFPNRQTLTDLLTSAILDKTYAPFYTFFYPLLNRIKNNVVLVGEN
ncbi:MAG TPA: PHP-associated domain-containing protein, partial [Candidatus Saccharimonadales bacterium]|nr:PHP-associated domain-containing protein [Candidatus Saccharimonadales bacterium]